jgi:uncharacterized protein (DUF1330 family)
MIVLAVTLTVRPELMDAFHSYEVQAAAIMLRHGGRIERVIHLDGGSADAGFHRELHIVSFPSNSSLEAYRRDPDLTALAALRARAIEHTSILTGRDAPGY